VLDRDGALPPSLALFTTDDAPTLAVTGPDATPAYAGRVTTWTVPMAGDRLDLGALLGRLGAGDGLSGGRRAVQSLLVEAGPGLATALLAQDLVDRVVWVVAPKLVGAGTPAVGDLGTGRMADARAFAESRWEVVGRDAVLWGYARAVGV
jgi:diaminohydroxyphosphoribosylaminopyrimidine deaminase/5-amino-6-(5-phosphoribosylamino)uracil reductase